MKIDLASPRLTNKAFVERGIFWKKNSFYGIEMYHFLKVLTPKQNFSVFYKTYE